MPGLHFRFALAALASLLLPSILSAADATPSRELPLDANVPLVETINRAIEARWQQADATPAELADDAEYLRRVTLDLVGRIPSVGEARDFLDSTDDDRRQQLVDRLLSSAEFSRTFAQRWATFLVGQGGELGRNYQTAITTWWYSRMLIERGLDEIARELLTAPRQSGNANRFVALAYGGSDNDARMAASGYREVPAAFYFAKESKPTEIAAAVTRSFMGVRLECAECHDHPFADWKQRDFWQLAAFFASNSAQTSNDRQDDDTDQAAFEIEIEGTDQRVAPAVPGGAALDVSSAESLRHALADWLVSPDNPYFARAMANRLWWMCFGRGLVEPVDDFDPGNPASHPELLAALAQALVDARFDARPLLRAIVLSRPYQLTSAQSHPSQQREELFAVMPVRRMAVEQFAASVQRAVGESGPVTIYTRDGEVYRSTRLSELLPLFSDASATPRAAPTSVAQALYMMNGNMVTQAVDPARGRLLGSVLEYPGWNNDQRMEAIYLAVLARRPTADEAQAVAEMLTDDAIQQELVLSDLYWALLNSSEFMFNH